MAQDHYFVIFSTWSKKEVFGIRESTKRKARKALFNKIGKDAYKWRFECRKRKKPKGETMGDIADHHVEMYSSGRWGMPNNKFKGRDFNMTDQYNQTRIVTGEVRFSFVNLLTPRAISEGAEPKFSVTILLPKTDVDTKSKLDAAIEAAKQVGKGKHWNNVIPPMVNIPIHDGDGVKPSDGMPFGNECKGHWVFSASTKADQPPKVVDASLNPIMDATEVYSGMYGKIALNFAPYKFSGKSGVGVYISTNVQKTRDGEPLGASAPAADSDFGPAQPQYHAPTQPGGQQQQFQQAPPQQPQYQQQMQQPNQVPNQQQFQQPNQVPNQQMPQQFDLITGKPLNGGVYGI